MQGVWIVFTAGAMGSGKTHTLRWLWQKGYFPLHAFVQGDPDRVRGMLPELPGYVERCPEVCLAGTARVELVFDIAHALFSERPATLLFGGCAVWPTAVCGFTRLCIAPAWRDARVQWTERGRENSQGGGLRRRDIDRGGAEPQPQCHR
jgi:hypothetical protein